MVFSFLYVCVLILLQTFQTFVHGRIAYYKNGQTITTEVVGEVVGVRTITTEVVGEGVNEKFRCPVLSCPVVNDNIIIA